MRERPETWGNNCFSTEQQAAARAQREQELAADAFRELDDNMDGV